MLALSIFSRFVRQGLIGMREHVKGAESSGQAGMVTGRSFKRVTSVPQWNITELTRLLRFVPTPIETLSETPCSWEGLL
jgi:hypothetical protein